MPLNATRLRLWFALAIAALVLLVLGFYLRGYYTRYLVTRAIQHKAENLGVNIQQSADHFTLSKSEGGHTLFTLRASKAVQVTGGHAELHDVNIVVYGNEGNRFDQIYGKSFDWDPKSGIVRADGEVHIDLQGVAAGQIRPDLAPPKELENPIHLKTSGLSFDRNTGIATTSQRIEFRVPQASGSAIGATLDSKSNRLTLHSAIELQQSGEKGSRLVAHSGLITKDPPRIEFTDAHITRETSNIDAQRLTVYLRDDNTIQKVRANGNVTAVAHGKTEAHAQAPQGMVLVDADNQVQTATLSGGVNFETQGDQPMRGTAGRVLFDFGGDSRLDKVRAVDNVRVTHDPPKNHPNGQSMTLDTLALDYLTKQHRAETVGPGRVVFVSNVNTTGALSSRSVGEGGNRTTTVATAARLIAAFDPKGHLQTLVGSPGAKVVSSSPGQPDKVTTSNVLTVTTNPTGGLARIVQEGNFHYSEAADKPGETGSEATAAKAVYDPQTQMFALTGNPRITDAGATTTADHMRVNRVTGDAFADGSVKTTYSELKPQPNGALLATTDPIHVTAAAMVAHRVGGTAVYSGGARLWQGSNIVEAPTIEFDRDKRTLVAQGKTGQPVSTVFVQQSQKGKQSPVNVTGSRLTYQDSDRQAHFDGGVVLRSADGTVSADRATVYLLPRSQNPASTKSPVENSASQLERIVAEGHVVIQQNARRGTGNQLVYLAKDASFTLTGGPPSIFDAEHGKVTGVSLTFFSHDDRVLVEGGNSAPSVTKARVIK